MLLSGFWGSMVTSIGVPLDRRIEPEPMGLSIVNIFSDFTV